MRIMVTGANGFVGPFVVRQLFNQHEVLGVDCLRYSKPRFSSTELRKFQLDNTDLRDIAKTKALLRDFNPDAIIHLAAIHFIPECEQFPGLAVSTNVQATVNLLTDCSPQCRFVFASTAAVYAPNQKPHREDQDEIRPMDVYGITKLAGEEFVKYFSELKGFPAVIVRLFNVIGPGETNPHVLPEIIRQLKKGDSVLRLGNLHPKRDYIYVEDAARGFSAAATAPLPDSRRVVIANLGSGKSHSVRKIVNRLSKITGQPVDVQTDPARKRKVDRPNLCSDNSYFQSLFNWKPEMPLDGALKQTWECPDMIRKLMVKANGSK